jgi:hypothetical protein
VHESGVPCQLGHVRFTPVQARRSSRVMESAYGSSAFFRFMTEEGFPAVCKNHGVFGAVSPGTIATSAARLVHPLPEFVDNFVDGGVRESVPCDGTRSKVSAHRAGATRAIGVERPLSTGRPVHRRQMDHGARVLPAEGGVRFGVCTGPMTQATWGCSVVAVAAPVGAVGR